MSTASKYSNILDATMRVDNLPSKGRRLKITANETQLKVVAKHLKIKSVESFFAQIVVTPIKAGFIVTGELKAKIFQSSVVTFEPVVQHVEEKLKRLFLLGKQENAQEDTGSESFIDLEGDDLPDYYYDREIDFSNYLLENLALLIELFPRNEGEEIDLAQINDEHKEISPFAKLKMLKATK